MNEEALKVHGTSLWLSNQRVVFSLLHYSFSPNCLSDKTGYLLEIFHRARIYHISNSMKPKGLTLVQALGGQEIGLFWLVDSYWGYLISHWLAILLIMVGFSTKPNANTAVCHWIMIWCSFLLTKIDVMMYIVQDRWGLLADENRESLGAVNCVIMDQGLL